ncbi:MAG: hypothetical protein ACHQM6_10960, partial [Candidatus Kapaibacterium sp.]
QQTPPGAFIVTGSGVLNTIPMWTPDGFKVGNSIMTQTGQTGITITPFPFASNNILFVAGVADATVANVAADPVWDVRIIGDELLTGRMKIGGSIWLDGTSATHQIVTDAPLNIGTKNGNTVGIVTGNTQRLTLDASGNTTITGGNTTINEGSGQFAINCTGSGFAAKINTSARSGLEIHCTQDGGTNLDNNTHFIDFDDGSGLTRGSIQGQNFSEYFADPIQIINATFLAVNVALVAGAAAAAVDPFSLPAGVVLVAQIAGLIAQYGAITGIQTNTTTGLGYGLGVSYGSSAGDYAEYLKRENPEDKFYPGDIVGMKNGLISKNTDGAQSVMSISLAPIVLGNVPPKGHEAEYSKVGFLGQVPVKVRGTVNAGDFIIASGLNDGIGIAVSPDRITPEQFTMVLGRSWEASDFSGIKYVKVAVGLNAKAMSEIISHEQTEIDALQKEVNELRKTNSEVASLKLKLEKMEKYLSQPEQAKEVMFKSN